MVTCYNEQSGYPTGFKKWEKASDWSKYFSLPNPSTHWRCWWRNCWDIFVTHKYPQNILFIFLFSEYIYEKCTHQLSSQPSLSEQKVAVHNGASLLNVSCQDLSNFCKRLPSHTGQEQACSRINRLVVHSFVTMPKMAQFARKWLLLPLSDHIQSETLFQTKQDQEWGMNGPASL